MSDDSQLPVKFNSRGMGASRLNINLHSAPSHIGTIVIELFTLVDEGMQT